MNFKNIYRGLIIVKPYGDMIRKCEKNMIVKSKKIDDIADKTLLLLEGKQAYGFIKLDFPKKINIDEFEKLYRYHLITQVDRKKWWNRHKILYAYNITDALFFNKPLLINYPIGPQITVKPSNISLKKMAIGTSGYSYPNFYPIKVDNKLEYYGKKLNSVEINHTFYRYPSNDFIKFLDKHNIIYSIKVNRHITHIKKLHNIENSWNKFYSSFNTVIHKVRCFLFQFDPEFAFNSENLSRLKYLGKIINRNHDFSFEFRHSSWLQNREVDNLFNEYGWTLVISHVMDATSWTTNFRNGFNPKISNYKPTSNFMYLRLHGSMGRYLGSYSSKFMKKIKEFISQKKIDNVYVYFNNTLNGYAFENAIYFHNMFNKYNLF